MYSVSHAFHDAVFAQKPKRVLLKFGDTILTNEDLAASSGFAFSEAVNPAEELTIGTCQTSVLQATINNQHRLLSGFEFGECEASLAVQTHAGGIEPSVANVRAIMRFGDEQPVIFEGFTREPFLLVNGSAPTEQPPFPVYSILTVRNTLYCISEDGDMWAALWVDGRMWNSLSGVTWDDLQGQVWDDIQGFLLPATQSEKWNDLTGYIWDELSERTWNSFLHLPEINDFMRHKLKGWAKARRGMSFEDNILYEFRQNSYEKYEYCKLGVFLVNTPKKRRRNLIAIDAEDRMSLFGVDVTEFWNGLIYPTTVGDVYRGLCDYVGVPAATISFINSNRVLAKAPFQASAIIGADILGAIAGAACSFARMTRDGETELAWFSDRTVNLNVAMDKWFNAEIAEYTVKQIDKLQVRNSANDIGVIIGEGLNAYQLVDNPFLYGATDAEVRVLSVPIYNRLAAVPEFSPIVSNALCDWSFQAGDVIEFEFRGETYRLPIYAQTITWRGGLCRVEYINSGNERRPELGAENRRIFQQNRAMHELTITIDGLKSEITDYEGRVATLEFNTSGLTLAVQSHRLTFDTSGLTTYNAQGQRTLWQDPTTGGLNISGNLQAATGTFSGSLQAASGTFRGELQAATGTFSGALQAASGTFTGALQAATGTFSGELKAASGTFSGDLTANTCRFANLESTSGVVRLGGLTLSNGNIESRGSLLIDSASNNPIHLNSGTYIMFNGSDYQFNNLRASSGATVVYGTGNTNIAYAASSLRYKHDVQPADKSLRDVVMQLRPKTFIMNDDDLEERQLGCVAEEVHEVCELLVGYKYPKDGPKIPDFLHYDRIPMLLTLEAQAARREREEAFDRIKALEDWRADHDRAS